MRRDTCTLVDSLSCILVMRVNDYRSDSCRKCISNSESIREKSKSSYKNKSIHFSFEEIRTFCACPRITWYYILPVTINVIIITLCVCTFVFSQKSRSHVTTQQTNANMLSWLRNGLRVNSVSITPLCLSDPDEGGETESASLFL